VTGSDTGGTSSDWAAIMLGTGPQERLIDTGFDLTFGLTANSRELRNHQITRPFKHALLAEREGFDVTQIRQVFKHICHLENITRPHLFGKLFKTILPIIRGGREIVG